MTDPSPEPGEPLYEELRFGFRYGPGAVTRIHLDAKLGVWFEVVGKRERVDVRVTRDGRIRVFKVKKNPAEYLSDLIRTGRAMLRNVRGAK